MSSGACRALVAVMLTLVATIVMSLPVAAKSEQLTETSNAIYKVHPSKGTIDVTVAVTLRPRSENWPAQEWRQVVVEENTRPSASGNYKVTATARDLPGLWEARGVKTPGIPVGERGSFILRYKLDASVDKSNAGRRKTPARINDSYMYFCVTGQDTHVGSVKVQIDNVSKWDISRPLGTPMDITDSGYESVGADNRSPGQIFTCFEGVRENRLDTETFIGPADRPFELHAWSGEGGWLDAAGDLAPDVLRNLHSFIGHDIPGEGPVIIRMAPARDIGGYASAHDTPGIVQLDELGGSRDAEHQLAHAWYGTDNFQDVWLREGMAEWTAGAMKGAACEPITDNPLELDLSEWMVVQPQSPEGYNELIDAQDAAACGIVAAVRERMPREIWNAVVGAMLQGETKYIGSAGAEVGTSTGVDYREWLDAIDERGLVPAATDPAYARNLDDLDFAQNLLDAFGVTAELPGGESELLLRSEARAAYHAFLAESAPLGAPHAVRKDMDDWEFRSAMSRIERSREVFASLTEADRLLPDADLLKIVQPQFEAAKNEAELDEVEELVANLLEGAQGVEGPLGDLQAALPLGWIMPVAVNTAISEQRFDDIMAAITPAITAAQEISAADAALPQAKFLDKYKALFETTTTAGKLDDLVADAKSDRLRAERAGRALEQLQAEVGDWVIPEAVTSPLEIGQIQTGVDIINDARGVIAAVVAADLALPEAGLREEAQPLFEAVTTGAEMAALRTQVEQRAAEADAVGTALSTLNRLVPTWQIPAVLADPVAAGDFGEAVATAQAAARWITFADRAQDALPELDALESIKTDFESAQSLADLQQGVELAQDQSEAADWVKRAKVQAAKDRDLLTDFGLWGVDIDAVVDEAVAAAIAGEVELAVNKSTEAISKLDGGASSGSLRLAGLVFFGVAVLGVLGLWVMLRRQAGPSWARSSTPHWMEDGSSKRGLLGRGKKKDDDEE